MTGTPSAQVGPHRRKWYLIGRGDVGRLPAGRPHGMRTMRRSGREPHPVKEEPPVSQHPTIALLPDAARIVTAMANGVLPEQWNNPSPCGEWTVRDVLNHLVGEHLWAPQLLAGATVEEVGDRFEGDLLGADPAGAWRRASSASMIAWAQADPQARVHSSMGLLPVEEYAHQMLLDLTVHGWDIAKGAGIPFTPIPQAVEDALNYATPRITYYSGTTMFAAPVPYEGDHPIEALAALLGRDPFWRPEHEVAPH